MKINRPNQVWCADITYIPLAKGFLYLVAIMDWHSRKVLSWRLSNTMDAFCVDALEEALSRYGNLYKEFRGNMASVDEALKPQQQIELFIKLTKSGGTLANRMFLGRKALTVLTSGGTRNLSAGLKALHVLDGGGILDAGVNTLRRMADSREVKAEYA